MQCHRLFISSSFSEGAGRVKGVSKTTYSPARLNVTALYTKRAHTYMNKHFHRHWAINNVWKMESNEMWKTNNLTTTNRRTTELNIKYVFLYGELCVDSHRLLYIKQCICTVIRDLHLVFGSLSVRALRVYMTFGVHKIVGILHKFDRSRLILLDD